MSAKNRHLQLDDSALLVKCGSSEWLFADMLDGELGAPLGTWPLKMVQSDDERGNHCVAARGLNAGVLICSEDPFAQTAHDSVDDVVCHVCYGLLPRKHDMCQVCGGVRYCSAACAADGKPAHDAECYVLQQLRSHASSAGNGVRGLRFFMRLVHRVSRDPASLHLLESNLQEHFTDAPVEKQQFLMSMAGRVNRLVPPTHRFDDEGRLARLISRAHVNLHSVSDCGGVTYGSALYPLYGAKFNHSCSPNAIVSFRGRTWRLHTLRKVARGEEITIAYTDLYAGLAERRAALQSTKFFTCACARCASPPPSDEEIDGWVTEGWTNELGVEAREAIEQRWRQSIESELASVSAQTASRALQAASRVLEQSEGKLRERHAIRHRARRLRAHGLDASDGASSSPSSSRARSLKVDLVAVLDQIVDDLSTILPAANHPELAYFRFWLSKALRDLAKHEQMTQAYDTKLLARADREALAAVKALEVAYGSDHPTVARWREGSW